MSLNTDHFLRRSGAGLRRLPPALGSRTPRLQILPVRPVWRAPSRPGT